MENQNQTINSVLEKIKNNEVKMTSRQFFLMKWLTISVTSLFFLFLGFYFFAYIVFLFVDNGLAVIPLSAEGSISKYIVEMPWTLIVLGLISVFLFSITSKTFYKIYKKPFLTFFFSVFMVIVLSQILLMETGTMKRLKEEAYKMGVHLAPEKLLQFRDSQTGNLFVGTVVSTTSVDNSVFSVIILDRRNNQIELFLENPSILNSFSIGDKVNAYGVKENGKIQIKNLEIVE